MFEILKIEPKFQKLTGENPLFEKSQSATVKVGDKTVGALGILEESTLNHFAIEGTVAAAEINLTTNYQLPTTNYSYHPLPKYPPVIEDISAIFDQKTTVAEIVQIVKRLGDPLVKQVEIIDIYQDPKLGKAKKSVTLRLSYQKSDGTPSQDEVARYREIITREIERIFKAQVRK